MRGELLVVEVPGPWQDSEKSCIIRVIRPVQGGGGGMMEFFHQGDGYIAKCPDDKSLCIPTLIASDRWKLGSDDEKTHHAQLPTRNSSPEAVMYIETDLLVHQVVAS